MKIFDILGPHSHPLVAIEVKFCTAKRTHVPVGPAKLDIHRYNESPPRGEKPDFWPVSKFNLPLCGILPVKNTTFSHLQPVRIVRSSPKLCMVIELVVPIIKGDFHFFDPTHSFSYRVDGKIWPNLPTCGFSAITP